MGHNQAVLLTIEERKTLNNPDIVVGVDLMDLDEDEMGDGYRRLWINNLSF